MNSCVISDDNGVDALSRRLREGHARGVWHTVTIKEIAPTDAAFIPSPAISRLHGTLEPVTYPAVVEPLIGGHRVQVHIDGDAFRVYEMDGRRLGDVEAGRYDLRQIVTHRNCALEVIADRAGILCIVGVLRIGEQTHPQWDACDYLLTHCVAPSSRGHAVLRRLVDTFDDLSSFLSNLTSCTVTSLETGERFLYDAAAFGVICVGKYAEACALEYHDSVAALWRHELQYRVASGTLVRAFPITRQRHRQLHLGKRRCVSICRTGRPVDLDVSAPDLPTVLLGEVGDGIKIHDCVYRGTGLLSEGWEVRQAAAQEACQQYGWERVEGVPVLDEDDLMSMCDNSDTKASDILCVTEGDRPTWHIASVPS